MFLNPGFVPFFRNKFPGIFQASDYFSRTPKLTWVTTAHELMMMHEPSIQSYTRVSFRKHEKNIDAVTLSNRGQNQKGIHYKNTKKALLTRFRENSITLFSLTDFQDFPGPALLFQGFPVLENEIIKFQDFPGFPGPVQTL